jgi:hypothetical protein
MKFHITKTFAILTDTSQVINLIATQLIPLNVKIIEQTETILRFGFTGNFLRATHPIAWVNQGLLTVTSLSEPGNAGLTQISIHLNLRKIRWFLILFPLVLCGGLTLVAYTILGSSIRDILHALGLMYLMVFLAMFLGYIFVKQIVLRYFQTLCEILPLLE